MASEKGRNCVVHAGSRGGDVAVGVGIHPAATPAAAATLSSSSASSITTTRCHPLVADTQRVSARSGNTVLRQTTCVVVMSLPLRGPSSTSYKAVARLFGRGAEVDALVCAAPACVPAVHQGNGRTPDRTLGRSGAPMAVDLSCARAGSCCRQQPPSAVVCHAGDQAGLRHGVLPVLLAGAPTLVHHARGLLDAACACGARSGSATLRTRSCLCALSTRPALALLSTISLSL
eukprot:6213994-Pleurochrysis_carterae.AAC.1